MIPKIVLVGAGRFGKNHLKALIELENKNKIKLIGIVELDPKIRKNLKNQYNIPISKNIEKFVKEADGFDIVTPPNTHFRIIKYLLSHKKNVFVEKPLTTNSKESEIVTTLAKNKNVILQVGHIFRFNPTVVYLKKLLKQKINSPFLIKAEFLQSRIQKHDTSSIFVFMHGIDIIDHITDKKQVEVIAIANLMKKNIDLNSTVIMKYNDFNAHIDLGWIPSGTRRNIEILSKKRLITCDLVSNLIQIHENNKITKSIKIQIKELPLTSELKEFAKCIKNKKKPTVDGEVGTRIVRICEIAINSFKKNKKNFSLS